MLQRLVPLSCLRENPWRPSASVGEARHELQGTVEDWLTRELPTTAKDDRDHGANFLRAAVKQMNPSLEEIASSILEGKCGCDSAALTWLWMSTESVAKETVATFIVGFAKAWRPYVQSPDFRDQVLQRAMRALEGTVRTAECVFMLLDMAREPRFDCPDAEVPAASDVLHGFQDDDDVPNI